MPNDTPKAWMPFTESMHRIAEGVNILAGRVYESTGMKSALKSITLDFEYAIRNGMEPGMVIHTATGPVKICVERAETPRVAPYAHLQWREPQPPHVGDDGLEMRMRLYQSQQDERLCANCNQRLAHHLQGDPPVCDRPTAEGTLLRWSPGPVYSGWNAVFPVE